MNLFAIAASYPHPSSLTFYLRGWRSFRATSESVSLYWIEFPTGACSTISPLPPPFKGGNQKSPFCKGRFRGIFNLLKATLTLPWAFLDARNHLA